MGAGRARTLLAVDWTWVLRSGELGVCEERRVLCDFGIFLIRHSVYIENQVKSLY